MAGLGSTGSLAKKKRVTPHDDEHDPRFPAHFSEVDSDSELHTSPMHPQTKQKLAHPASRPRYDDTRKEVKKYSPKSTPNFYDDLYKIRFGYLPPPFAPASAASYAFDENRRLGGFGTEDLPFHLGHPRRQTVPESPGQRRYQGPTPFYGSYNVLTDNERDHVQQGESYQRGGFFGGGAAGGLAQASQHGYFMRGMHRSSPDVDQPGVLFDELAYWDAADAEMSRIQVSDPRK